MVIEVPPPENTFPSTNLFTFGTSKVKTTTKLKRLAKRSQKTSSTMKRKKTKKKKKLMSQPLADQLPPALPHQKAAVA